VLIQAIRARLADRIFEAIITQMISFSKMYRQPAQPFAASPVNARSFDCFPDRVFERLCVDGLGVDGPHRLNGRRRRHRGNSQSFSVDGFVHASAATGTLLGGFSRFRN
jgi:hypothetical protein